MPCYIPAWFRSPRLLCSPLVLVVTASLCGQSTQGTIAGRAFDRRDAKPLSSATVLAFNASNQEVANVKTDSRGYYFLGLLSPGKYRLRAQLTGYQAQEAYDLELLVASQLRFNFQLRRERDLFESDTNHFALLGNDRVIPYFGEDTEVKLKPVEIIKSDSRALQAVVSYVVDSRELEALPLAGRDVYSILALQPGVTSDSSTARGVGLSVNGQRPSASNYLLDGLENNNYLVSGPLFTLAPEAIQEYRISTNSFSAEYGGTAGYIANAVVRKGGNQWHGAAYFYFRNDRLNANDFQRNALGLPVTPLRQWEPGLVVGGPLIANRLYVSISGDHLQFRSLDLPQTFRLPTANYQDFAQAGTIARSLLQQFPHSPVTGSPGGATALVTIAPPSSASVDQSLAMVRADAFFKEGKHRLLIRPLLMALDRPTFIWSPYKDFITPLRQSNAGIASSLSNQFGRASSEARFAFSRGYLGFARRWPGIPSLLSGDGTVLPGSPAFYGFEQEGKNLEIGEHVIVPLGRHLLRFGGGGIFRNTAGYLSAGRDSIFSFLDFARFAADQPFVFATSVSRSTPVRFSLPDYQREYKTKQFSLFAQDTFQFNSRLSLDLGVRYENFGAPVNSGPIKDAQVQLGTGRNLGERIAAAKIVTPDAGDQRLYDADPLNFAIRGGFSYAMRRNGRLVFRGSYGIFYDRPFDNLWQNIQNNAFTTASFQIQLPGRTNYLQPILNLLSSNLDLNYDKSFPNPVVYQPDLRTGYAQSFFAGLQYRVGENLTLELNGLGSLGRSLITTDLINRRNSVPRSLASLTGQFNASLPEMSYRANQGASNYTGLTLVARQRRGSVQFQGAYTLSHSIDNQSDPLAGDFFDLTFTRIVSGAQGYSGSGFTRQFDSHSDRANADFDQRQNLVGSVIWYPPPWLRYRLISPLSRNWSVSALGAARSGFPFSVYAAGTPELLRNRADVLNPGQVYTSGGSTFLNRAAFQNPASGSVGNSGRNAFRGPGLASLDCAVSRSFSWKAGDKQLSLKIRADAFNVLNHANLNNPEPSLTSQNFGLATAGRLGRTNGFPAVSPFNETARQIQFMVKIDF